MSNTYTRVVRAQAALTAYTTALHYFQSRPHAQAVKLTEERIAHHRRDLEAANAAPPDVSTRKFSTRHP